MAIGQLPQSQAAAGFFLDLRGRWVHLLRACFKALSGPPQVPQINYGALGWVDGEGSSAGI
jgi:hypothetical protein